MKTKAQKVVEIKAQTNGRQLEKPVVSTFSAIIRDSSAYDVGECAVEDALRAICKHFGHVRPFILRT